MIARPRENPQHIKDKPISMSKPNHNSQGRHVISEYHKTTVIHNRDDPSSTVERGTTNGNKDNKNRPRIPDCAQKDLAESHY